MSEVNAGMAVEPSAESNEVTPLANEIMPFTPEIAEEMKDVAHSLRLMGIKFMLYKWGTFEPLVAKVTVNGEYVKLDFHKGKSHGDGIWGLEYMNAIIAAGYEFNIGVSLGDSGLINVDCDRNHGDGSKDGVAYLGTLLERCPATLKGLFGLIGSPFSTYSQTTPNNGRHYFFRVKKDLSGFDTGEGLELKTSGACLLSPSFVNMPKKVGQYVALCDITQITEASQELMEFLDRLPRKEQGSVQGNRVPFTGEVVDGEYSLTTSDICNYLNGILKSVIKDGSRDNTLFGFTNKLILLNLNDETNMEILKALRFEPEFDYHEEELATKLFRLTRRNSNDIKERYGEPKNFPERAEWENGELKPILTSRERENEFILNTPIPKLPDFGENTKNQCTSKCRNQCSQPPMSDTQPPTLAVADVQPEKKRDLLKKLDIQTIDGNDATTESKIAAIIIDHLSVVLFNGSFYLKNEEGYYLEDNMTDRHRDNIINAYAVGKSSKFRGEIKSLITETCPHKYSGKEELPIQFKNCYLYQGKVNDGIYDGFTPYSIPLEYVAECNPTPSVDLFMNTITGKDKDYKAFIYEMVGYCFVTNLSTIQKHSLFFCMHGDGGSGKGTLFQLIISILGEKHCSVHLKDLEGDFKNVALCGALANLLQEEPPTRVESHEMTSCKRLTVGEQIVVNPKNKTPYNITPKCTMIIAFNEMPSFEAKDNDLARRLRVLPFGKPLDTDKFNSRVFEELKSEESVTYFLSQAVKGYVRLHEKGTFTECQRVNVTTANQIRANNSVIDYVESLKVSDILMRSISDITEDYVLFCSDNGENVQKKTTRLQKQILDEHGITFDREASVKIDGKPYRFGIYADTKKREMFKKLIREDVKYTKDKNPCYSFENIRVLAGMCKPLNNINSRYSGVYDPNHESDDVLTMTKWVEYAVEKIEKECGEPPP